MIELTENIYVSEVQLSENINSKNITLTEVGGNEIVVNENCTVVKVDYTFNKVVRPDGVSQTVLDRITDLETMLFNIEMHDFDINVNLFDNTEETYTITVTGAKSIKNYALIFNNSIYGLSAELNSWGNDTATVTIKNNTGTNINSIFNLKLQEILKS